MDPWTDDIATNPLPVSAPKYCPGCGRRGRERSGACPACGLTMLDQGYCPVCESFVPAPAGSPCPKHDVALEEHAVDPRFAPPAGEAIDWVTIMTYIEAMQAEAPRLRLEAEGIPTFVEGERMGRNSLYAVATGGVKLQVPRALADDARVLLAQSWTPPEAEDDLDDAWDDLAPEPGATRRRVMKGVMVFYLLTPVVLFLLSLLFLLLLG